MLCSIPLYHVHLYHNLRTDAGNEMQVRGVKYLIVNRHRTRQEQLQHTGKQGQMTFNAETGNREWNPTDMGKVSIV